MHASACDRKIIPHLRDIQCINLPSAWDRLRATLDTRQFCGKERIVGITGIGLRLFAAVAADRDQVRWIAGMREANRRKRNRYAQTESRHGPRGMPSSFMRNARD